MTAKGMPYRFGHNMWGKAPRPLREHVSRSSHLVRIKNQIRDSLAKAGSRDDIYNMTYYRHVDSMARPSAVPIAEMILNEFAPNTAVDLGCGTGAMLVALRDRGVTVVGLEYSRAAIEICRRRGLDVREYNIEAAPDLANLGQFDVVICTEVAEHVKPQFADDLVNQFVALSDQVVFTAAVPGQGGLDHVNEQPQSYWVHEFARHGYEYVESRSTARRQELLRAGVVGFYARNLMMFRRA